MTSLKLQSWLSLSIPKKLNRAFQTKIWQLCILMLKCQSSIRKLPAPNCSIEALDTKKGWKMNYFFWSEKNLGSTPPPPQFWLPNFSKGSPFAIILWHPCLDEQPLNFSKGAFAIFLVKIFQKVPKNAFVGLFLWKFCLRCKKCLTK